MPTSAVATAAEPTTDRVRSLSGVVRERTSERDAAISQAHNAGVSIARLSRAAELDPGTIRRILQRTG